MKVLFYSLLLFNVIWRSYENQSLCEHSKIGDERCLFKCIELKEFHGEYFENFTNCQISLYIKSSPKSNSSSKIVLNSNYFKGNYQSYSVDKIVWKLNCVERIEKNFLQNLLTDDNTKLWILSITGSRCLQSIGDGVFESLSYLRNLDLSYNNIAELSIGAFRGLSMLETLKLTNNRLTHVADAVFDPLKSLETLELSRNDIVRIEPSAFQSVNRLQLLKLNRNQIGTLPQGVFGSFEVLHTLDLSSNKLESFDEDLLSSLSRESLRNLFLSNNRLKTLSSTIIDFENIDPSHFDLVLDNNSWLCDIRLAWMQQKPAIYFIKPSSIKCADPYQFRNKTLDRISLLHLNYAYKEKIFSDLSKDLSLKDELIGVVVSVVCVVLILAILLLGYRYNWCSLIKGYNIKSKKFKTGENESDEKAKLCMITLEGNKII